MNPNDLAKLRIDRAAPVLRPRRRWRVLLIVSLLTVIAAAVAWTRFAAPVTVEAVTVATVYPSQNYTLLNATGYVVPQRKAALSSKGTGRLEWLGVLEGSRVKADEVIARLESRDVRATLEQAAAQVQVAQANLQQGFAELRDAEANFKRSTDLLSKKFISSAQHDSDTARLGKARAAIASQKAAVTSAEASRRDGSLFRTRRSRVPCHRASRTRVPTCTASTAHSRRAPAHRAPLREPPRNAPPRMRQTRQTPQ